MTNCVKLNIINTLSILIGLLIILISFFCSGCNKDDINWNLERTNPNDSINRIYSLIKSYDCENLSDFQLTASGLSTPSAFYWEINSGYIGNGMHLEGTPNGLIGSINFSINLNKRGVVRFWIFGGNQKPNYPNCDIEVNGNLISKYLIGEDHQYGSQYGWVDYFEWWNLQTVALSPGNYNFTIQVYSNTIIDEIEIYEIN